MHFTSLFTVALFSLSSVSAFGITSIAEPTLLFVSLFATTIISVSSVSALNIPNGAKLHRDPQAEITAALIDLKIHVKAYGQEELIKHETLIARGEHYLVNESSPIKRIHRALHLVRRNTLDEMRYRYDI
jgi:hypothetical protein